MPDLGASLLMGPSMACATATRRSHHPQELSHRDLTVGALPQVGRGVLWLYVYGALCLQPQAK